MAIAADQATPNNLPLQATSFIGRKNEIEAIHTLLKVRRLVTLVGSGGCGKTRLAIESAVAVLDRYEDGVWFVELASVSDGESVVGRLAGVLRASLSKDLTPTECLVRAIGNSHVLIVLDNCEHVLQACTELAKAIHASCARATILSTSRHLLDVPGETVLRVPSLRKIDPRDSEKLTEVLASEAVRLFAERVRILNPDFQVDASNARDVCNICDRLDGIPLAIELAAAQTRSMSIAEVDGALDNCFRVLRSGNLAALPRQQTLRATIEWSVRLLSQAERRLLGRLSVFSGGFTLDAVEAICMQQGESAMADFVNLCDQSLVFAEGTLKTSRRRLLETVRQYAQDLLDGSGEFEQISHRHRDYFADLASQARPEKHEDSAPWLERLEAESNNLRDAILFSLRRPEDHSIALQMCVDLWWFWYQKGHVSDGMDLLSKAIQQEPDSPVSGVFLDAMYYYGWLLNSTWRNDEAEATFEKLATLSREIDDLPHLADALNGLGLVAYYSDYDKARSYLDEAFTINKGLPGGGKIASNVSNLCFVSLAACDYARARIYGQLAAEIAVEQGRRENESVALFLLAVICHASGDTTGARDYFKRAEAIQRKHGYRQRLLHTLVIEGEHYVDSGEPLTALTLFREAEMMWRELDAAALEHQVAGGLGMTYTAIGKPAEGRPFLERSLELCRHVDETHHIARILASTAAYLHQVGLNRDAARMLGAAYRLRTDGRARISPSEQSRLEAFKAPIAESLGNETFETLYAEGFDMDPQTATARALSSIRS